MNETRYSRDLRSTILELLPGSFVIRNDPTQFQGIPDILVLYENKWAMLEIKISADADHQPNQDYYIAKFNEMSFAAFIYPEVEEAVLSELQSAFGVGG